MTDQTAVAHLGGQLAIGLLDVTDDLAALDSAGWWAVVVTFEGDVTCARFDHVRKAPRPSAAWRAPARSTWTSSLSRDQYLLAVGLVRELVAGGEVYQVNVCRVLSAALPEPAEADIVGLADALFAGNSAPHQGFVRLPEQGVHVATASPETFLRVENGRVTSRPIKGTANSHGDFLPKDRDENVMIVDLVRNDLGVISVTGSVEVPELCVVEEHPGVSHLVSTVTGQLKADATWPSIMGATFPPGSVSGAPKSSALRTIRELEPIERGPYCGAVGWVDADAERADLAVGIRTFWLEGGRVNFGTGAGITWGSDAEAEWAETELKAARLLAIASHDWPGSAH